MVGLQEPTVHVAPTYVSSAGPEVCALADSAGLHLDPWQRLVLRDGLGERADGRWAAFEAAVMVARQNGKGAIFEARCLGGLFVLGERLIMYSAHEFKTAQEMFKRIEELIAGTAHLRKRVKAVSRSKGDEGITLVTGQRLRFFARSGGSGRGFSGDCNIWDEAQHLGNGPVDAMMPTMSARPNPQLWYGCSAPDKDMAPCDQIARVRERALTGGEKAARLAYFEWSAALCTDLCRKDCTDHDDPADPQVWARTNPGLGIRISAEHIGTERSSMSPRGFARERLSVGNYPVTGGGWAVISEAAWTATADPASHALDPVAFAVDVTPDRSAAAIAIAGQREDGGTHLELVDHRSGTGWVVERLKQLDDRWSPCAVVLDPAGPAGSLVADLEDAGVELTLTGARDAAAATGALYDAIVRPPNAPADWAPTAHHVPHPSLNSALAGAARRRLGDAWAWDRRGVSVDISPLVAITLARWGWTTRPREEAPVEPWAAWS
ncbi:terminase [Actinomadura harenae]|uniref:Terminase n=1 Tax=Actinomadura harenae TaxID=2483351 RepID=A0A3M2LTL4_9ACTN|nr:terminase [Actinomadura harenae]